MPDYDLLDSTDNALAPIPDDAGAPPKARPSVGRPLDAGSPSDAPDAPDAPEARPAARQERAVSLAGRFFHSFDAEGAVVWQGRIEGEVSPGVYAVTTFDWISGLAARQRLATVARMAAESWHFYDDNRQMLDAYDHDLRHRHKGHADAESEP